MSKIKHDVGCFHVRSKVRYWITDIVDEMRKKSPASVQKWVDSIQMPNQAGSSSEVVAQAEQKAVETEAVGEKEEIVENENVLTKSTEALEESIEEPKKESSFKKLLSKNAILEKFSRSSSNLDQDDDLNTEAPKKSSSFASISKTKINEFYDKLSLNKNKYDLIKAKKMDIKSLLSSNKENVEKCQKQLETSELVPEVKEDPIGEYEFSFEEAFSKEDRMSQKATDSEDEKENIDTPPQFEYLTPKKNYRMGMGAIGRSSSENPSTTKRHNLIEIGRSFSEMDDGSFVINEGNNSCPNPSSLNNSSSINDSTSNVVTRSVPVSPIPRAHSMQQETSLTKRRRNTLLKESSIQSDSSRCSSVESLLNARKPDPESILVNLGFGPAHTTDVLSKIPKRFLKPSQVRGVDTEAFLRQQQLSMHIHENSVLGYRGLVGNPHLPPSSIVAKIMERFEYHQKKRMMLNLTQNDGIQSSRPSSPMHSLQPAESRT